MFPKGTLDGHIQQFDEKQETLRQAIVDYEQRCGNKLPERIHDLATRRNPYPQAKLDRKIFAAVIVGVFAGVVSLFTGGQMITEPATLVITPRLPADPPMSHCFRCDNGT